MAPAYAPPGLAAKQRHRWVLVFGVLASLLPRGVGVARAQPCGPPDLVWSLPLDGAAEIPTNARLAAAYGGTAAYRGELVVLHPSDGPERSFEPVVEGAAEDGPAPILEVTPSDGLAADRDYVLRWPALRAEVGGAPGTGAVVRFRTGPGPDERPPSFGGIRSVEWDASPAGDCEGDGSYRFRLALGEADDDAGRTRLEALVFVTRGPTVDEGEPPLRVARTLLPPPGESLVVRLAEAQAVGTVCWSVVLEDLAGNVSEAEERCVTTVRPPFFDGCAAAPSGRGTAASPPLWLLVGLVAALALTLRRRGPRTVGPRGRPRP